jgi:predicted ATPase
MLLINYVRISNFKTFGDNIVIDFSQPSVLIGPNNSGKTSVLQALAMWNMGVRTWFREKGSGKSKSKMGTSVNRLSITQVPVQESKYLWQNAIVRNGTSNKELKITVGLFYEGKVRDCSIVFTYFNAESIYCFPDEASAEIDGLLAYASELDVKILYPMSGISREEPLIAEGRIDVLVGQGQTSEVLRNICYKIVENDTKNSTKDWESVTNLMKKLFAIKLQRPIFNSLQGTVELSYLSESIKSNKNHLDIGLSGRGQQEILLLIAYIYTHKKSILLLDEPDAHLEILRQKQVFSLLKKLAEENANQIIIATHSEVILNEAADKNLVLLINGQAISLSEPNKKTIKSSLKDYGLEHYYKAKVSKAVFYLEGNTDFEIFRAFSKKLEHRLLDLLDDKIYTYYTTDIEPDTTLDKDFNKASGYYTNAKKHFQAISSCVPTLKGIGVFDNDNHNRSDDVSDKLSLLYWKKYEIENYFTFPYIIEEYMVDFFRKQNQPKTEIELGKIRLELENIINQTILEELLNNNSLAFEDYKKVPIELKKELFKSFISSKKASTFLESVFSKISQEFGLPSIMNKGNYYELVKYLNKKDIDPEIIEKLNEVFKCIS